MKSNWIISLFISGFLLVAVDCDCDFDNSLNKLYHHHSKSKSISSGNNLKGEASIDRLKCLLNEKFNKPRNHLVNPVDKELSRNYLISEMKKYSDEVIIQTFDQPGESNIKGVNVIGIVDGTRRNSSDDNLILIGAHYDTYLTINDVTPGINDNGSGLAVLLEVLRLVSIKKNDPSYKPVNSIMFVAFDFEEYGYTGSETFVDKYLIPNELKGNESASFQGAIIMDTILNYNTTKGSQSYPREADLIAPGIGKWVKSNDYRGNFLALISRQSIDSQLNENFIKSWNQIVGKGSFKILPIELPSTNDLIGQFLRSDHVNFWFHDSRSYSKNLPAIFLTDTGNFRGIMEKCYHRACDDKRLITENNLSWIAHITNTITSIVTSFSLFT